MSTDGGDDGLRIKVTLDDSAFRSRGKESLADFDRQAEKVMGKVSARAKATGTDRATAARKAADAEVESFAKARDALGRFASEGKKDLAGLDTSASGLIGTFQKFAGSVVTINAVGAAFRGISGTMHEATEEARKQVDHLLQLKNAVRDIASMTGSAGGSSDAFIQKHLNIRKESGLDDAGARAFVEGFAGSGEAKKGINISPGEYEAAKPLIAKFAAANSSGDAGAVGSFGNLAGLLLGFRRNQTAGGALTDITNFNEILKAGVGDNPTLIREAAQQAGAVLNAEGTGIVRDPNQLAALISTASIQRSPGQAGTVVQQANRVLRGFTGSQKGLLEGAGITPEDDMIGALGKLFGKIQEAESRGVAPDVFLAAGGVDAMEDRQSIQALYSGRGYLGRFLGQAARPMTEAQSRAQLDATFRADTALDANVKQARLDEAKAHNAMLLQHTKALELEAETNLTRRGEGADSAAAAAEDESRGFFETGFGFMRPSGMSNRDVGRKIRLEKEMNAILRQRGIEVPGRPSDATFAGGLINPAFVPWLTGAGAMEAYAAATSTAYLGQQVMPGGMPTPRISLPAAHAAARGPESPKVVGLLEQLGTAVVTALNPIPRGPLPPARPGPGWTR